MSDLPQSVGGYGIRYVRPNHATVEIVLIGRSADYVDIDSRYGTLEDWDRLLKGCHDRGMKLMMDLVVNHTSDEVCPVPLYLRLLTNCSHVLASDSMHGSKSLEEVGKSTIRNATGTSGVLPNTMPKAIVSLQIIGSRSSKVRPPNILIFYLPI